MSFSFTVIAAKQKKAPQVLSAYGSNKITERNAAFDKRKIENYIKLNPIE